MDSKTAFAISALCLLVGLAVGYYLAAPSGLDYLVKSGNSCWLTQDPEKALPPTQVSCSNPYASMGRMGALCWQARAANSGSNLAVCPDSSSECGLVLWNVDDPSNLQKLDCSYAAG